MTLYNNNFYPEDRYASLYPSWVKCENYEECEDFLAEYSSIKSRSDSLFSRKAASLMKTLRRFCSAETAPETQRRPEMRIKTTRKPV